MNLERRIERLEKSFAYKNFTNNSHLDALKFKYAAMKDTVRQLEL